MSEITDQPKLVATIKKGRDKPVRMGHPWVFSGAIQHIAGDYCAGDLCVVQSHDRTPLGIGYCNRDSAISIRMLAGPGESFTAKTLACRIRNAIERRTDILSSGTSACRLINSEGDFLPGLIVDQTGDGMVVQILTFGMERFRDTIIATLKECGNPQYLFERSDSDSRKREGLPPAQGPLFGTPPEQITIMENDLTFVVDVKEGQKTGYFLDQRHNRLLLRTMAQGKTVCDCFSYSGGFAVNALKGGAATVDAVDISASAIEWARENVHRNFGATDRARFICQDVFKFLRETSNSYDCIVLDPPKFAKHPREVDRAARGYKDINLCALKRLNPGGLLFTFSCSNAVDAKLFRQIVFAAAADSGRQVQLLHILSAGPDHPVNVAHLEGEYLKGLVLRVIA